MTNIRNFIIGFLLWFSYAFAYAGPYAMGPACYGLSPLNRTEQDVLNDLKTIYFKDALISADDITTRYYPSSVEWNSGNVYVLPFYYEPSSNNYGTRGFSIRDTEFERAILKGLSAYTGLSLMHWNDISSDDQTVNIAKFFIDRENFVSIVQNNEFVAYSFNSFLPRKKEEWKPIDFNQENIENLEHFGDIGWGEVDKTGKRFIVRDFDVINLYLSDLSYKAFFLWSLFNDLTMAQMYPLPENEDPDLSLMDLYVLCAKYSKNIPVNISIRSYLPALSQEIAKLSATNHSN